MHNVANPGIVYPEQNINVLIMLTIVKCHEKLFKGKSGHLVHLTIRMQTFLQLACFCSKQIKTVANRLKSNNYEVVLVVLYANYTHKSRTMRQGYCITHEHHYIMSLTEIKRT